MRLKLKTGIVAISAINILLLFISIATFVVCLKVLQAAKKGSVDIIQVRASEASPVTQMPVAINRMLDRMLQLHIAETQPQEVCTGGIYYPKLHNYTSCVYNYLIRENPSRDVRYYEEACLHLLM